MFGFGQVKEEDKSKKETEEADKMSCPFSKR
jgi:hypothetical protein